MPRCMICRKEKNHLALHLRNKDGVVITECMECTINEWAEDTEFAKEQEQQFVTCQQDFFTTIDKTFWGINA